MEKKTNRPKKYRTRKQRIAGATKAIKALRANPKEMVKLIKFTRLHEGKGKGEKENYPVATCTRCGDITEIQQSHAWRSIMAQLKTYKEKNAMIYRDNFVIHNAKNGQIHALYKFIGEMYAVMNEQQKIALLSSKQEMRDAIKGGLAIMLGKNPKSEEKKLRRRKDVRIIW